MRVAIIKGIDARKRENGTNVRAWRLRTATMDIVCQCVVSVLGYKSTLALLLVLILNEVDGLNECVFSWNNTRGLMDELSRSLTTLTNVIEGVRFDLFNLIIIRVSYSLCVCVCACVFFFFLNCAVHL